MAAFDFRFSPWRESGAASGGGIVFLGGHRHQCQRPSGRQLGYLDNGLEHDGLRFADYGVGSRREHGGFWRDRWRLRCQC